MAGDVNKSVSINYTANIENLEKQLRKIPNITDIQADKAARELDQSFKKMERDAARSAKNVKQKMDKMKKGFAEVGKAVAILGTATFVLIKKIADLSNELVDASTKSGLAVDTLAGLRLAAESSGQEFSSLESGLVQFGMRMDTAAGGSKELSDKFAALNVEITNANGELRDTDSVFNEVIVSLGKMENETERNAAAMRLFGETAGPALIQSGALTNLQDMTRFSKEFGISLKEDSIKGMADLQVAIAQFGTVAFGVFNELILAIAGPNGATNFVKGMSSAFIFVGKVASDIMRAIGQSFENFFGFIQSGILVIQGDFGLAVQLIKSLSAESMSAAVNLSNTFNNASAAVDKFNSLSSSSSGPKTFGVTQDAAKEAGEQIDKTSGSVRNMKKEVEDLSKSFEGIGDNINQDLMTPTDEANKRFEETKDKLDEISEKLKTQMAELPESGGTTEQQKKRLELLELEKELTQSMLDNEARLKRDLKEIDDQIRQEKIEALQEENELKEKLHLEEMERLKAQRQVQLELLGSTHDVFQDVMSAFTAQYEAIAENTTRVRDEQIKAVEDLEKKGLITAEQAAARRLFIEEQFQAGINQHKMKAYKSDKVASIADVIFNTAIAVTKAFADFGATPAGIAAAILSSTQGAAQIAAIQSAPVPKFDIGGMVGNRDSMQPDQIRTQLLSGEAVLDRTTVRNLGGESGLRDLQNNGMSQQVIIIQPFKHFDRYNRALKKRYPERSGSRAY